MEFMGFHNGIHGVSQCCVDFSTNGKWGLRTLKCTKNGKMIISLATVMEVSKVIWGPNHPSH